MIHIFAKELSIPWYTQRGRVMAAQYSFYHGFASALRGPSLPVILSAGPISSVYLPGVDGYCIQICITAIGVGNLLHKKWQQDQRQFEIGVINYLKKALSANNIKYSPLH